MSEKKARGYIYIGMVSVSECNTEAIIKIGETGRLMCQREYEIRKRDFDRNFTTIMAIPFAGTKSERLYIEATIRLAFERKGYKQFGNDHFIVDNDEIYGISQVLTYFQETTYNAIDKVTK